MEVSEDMAGKIRTVIAELIASKDGEIAEWKSQEEFTRFYMIEKMEE